MDQRTQTAAILAIGDELISGQCVDTNSAFLARRLAERGIRTTYHETVGDDGSAIVDALVRTAGLADVVIVSGGLGPTADDRTRHALAKALGVELELDASYREHLEAFFRQRGRPLSEANRIQMMLPAGAIPLANRMGTACGMSARLARADVFCLPGVPHEMRTMFDEQVLPRLTAGESVIVHRAVHTFGCAESDVGAALSDLMTNSGPVQVGTTVSAGVISVRITAQGEAPEQTRGLVDQTADEVRQRLGSAVFGQDEDTLAAVVGRQLLERDQTLSTAESCTGGLIGKMLTDLSGSSAYYRGGVIAYANDVKVSHLAVPEELLAEHGAVSAPVAVAMAEGARQRMVSDWAVSTTGIAGPTGGTAAKPVGLVFVGLAGPNGTDVAERRLVGSREIVRLRASRAALNALRLAMRDVRT